MRSEFHYNTDMTMISNWKEHFASKKTYPVTLVFGSAVAASTHGLNPLTGSN